MSEGNCLPTLHNSLSLATLLMVKPTKTKLASSNSSMFGFFWNSYQILPLVSVLVIFPKNDSFEHRCNFKQRHLNCSAWKTKLQKSEILLGLKHHQRLAYMDKNYHPYNCLIHPHWYLWWTRWRKCIAFTSLREHISAWQNALSKRIMFPRSTQGI